MRFRDIQATIEKNLSKGMEELWENLDKEARWGVKKAKKEQLTIKEYANEDEWREFYELYKEIMVYSCLVPKDYEELKKETARLFLCMKEGKIIAGAAIKVRENKTVLFLNASNHEFLKFQPNNLLYWHIIEWGKKNNCPIFDLGGYQLNAKEGSKLYEINRFKERWGGEIKRYYVYSRNPLYILGRKIIRNFPGVKKTREKIKFYLWRKKSVKNRRREK
jgi:lipid II:glycine glycyltransferase (peptidoglycan interpeptide bridge formation enzyme)